MEKIGKDLGRGKGYRGIENPISSFEASGMVIALTKMEDTWRASWFLRGGNEIYNFVYVKYPSVEYLIANQGKYS